MHSTPIDTGEPLRVARDERGSVWEPLDAAGLARQRNVHVVVTRPGGVRGNHFHRIAAEVLVACGPALIRFRAADGSLHDVELPEGEVRRFDIPPGVAHAIRNTGRRDLVLVSFSNQTHDPRNPDVVRDVLIDPGA